VLGLAGGQVGAAQRDGPDADAVLGGELLEGVDGAGQGEAGGPGTRPRGGIDWEAQGQGRHAVTSGWTAAPLRRVKAEGGTGTTPAGRAAASAAAGSAAAGSLIGSASCTAVAERVGGSVAGGEKRPGRHDHEPVDRERAKRGGEGVLAVEGEQAGQVPVRHHGSHGGDRQESAVAQAVQRRPGGHGMRARISTATNRATGQNTEATSAPPCCVQSAGASAGGT
jgi:hypothetical protein